MSNPNEELKEKDVETLVEALLEHVSSLNENQHLIIEGLVEGLDKKIDDMIITQINAGTLDDRIRKLIREEMVNVQT